jgi:methyltransferase (TIGR00027 family)
MKESRTALGVAWLRAVHQILDSKPLILQDEPIVELLGRDDVERACKTQERFSAPGARLLRSHVVLRSRFAEDRLEASLARGVRQFVVLGAGYDTFFARQPAWAKSLRIFEIDQPATQEDKLARIAAARLTVPENVVFGSVNFEAESVAEGLRRHGVRFDVPTMFSWLGVTVYLTEPAIDATLSTVLSFPRGSEIALTFASRDHGGVPAMLAFPWREVAGAATAAPTPGAPTAAAPTAAAPTPGASAAGAPTTAASTAASTAAASTAAGAPAAAAYAATAAPPTATASAAPPAPDSDPTASFGATLASRAAAVGEPWLTYYEPDELARKLRHAGFSDVLLVTPEMATERYFAGRADGMPAPHKTSLLSAIV